ncbi:GGDEF domain-containing protein [Aquabacterium sp. A7-Y]|uniref:GGDEF domain-containing protein n=1 Tax=Aquabacterium sp. A7-Y TaxID=1349605 RepID=UPI00223D40D9|nr:GGDEF domain-containing protein [Aquabacterium sp. A7-Y]MCW7539154.1 GGDEF domain-containing protein [Aquabacterium sp. A7-Y]
MDFSIVSIIGAGLGLLLSALLGLAVRRVPDSDGAHYWALAILPLSVGSALVGRGEALPALLLVLREPLLLSGYALLVIGLRHYLRLSRPWALAGGVVLASLVVTALFTALLPNVAARIVVRCVGIAVLAIAALGTLGHVAGTRLREVRLYLQAGFGTIAALALLRAVLILLPLERGWVMQVQAAASMVTTVTILAVITGLALLMTARMNEALACMTVRDALTGLYNRRGLDEAVPGTLSFARRVGRPVALLVCDLDGFKTVNDSHGHATGDEVLQRVAHVLGAQFPQGALVGRLGGEEFVVLLPGADGGAALEQAERLRQAVKALVLAARDGTPLAVTVSIGVAAMAAEEADWDELLARADQALYQAKGQGRDRCTLAATRPAVPAPEAGLRAALGRGV